MKTDWAIPWFRFRFVDKMKTYINYNSVTCLLLKLIKRRPLGYNLAYEKQVKYNQ